MKPKLKFLLLAAIFAAPLVGAWLLFFVYPEWQPEGHTNHGTLVSPARPLPEVTFTDAAGQAIEFPSGKWTLVYVGAAQCDAACEARVLLGRQVRLALNQKRTRVQRVYLAPGPEALGAAQGQLEAAHPDMAFVASGDAELTRFFAPPEPHALYLLDPMGNWLMTYTGDVQHKGLHKDLKKLLRWSQAG